MVLLLRQCLGTAGKVCNRFLPVKDKDPNLFCISCRGKGCKADSQCGDGHDWDDKMWHKVNDHHMKLAAPREKKEERKAKAVLLSSFFGFSPTMPIPLCELSSLVVPSLFYSVAPNQWIIISMA